MPTALPSRLFRPFVAALTLTACVAAQGAQDASVTRSAATPTVGVVNVIKAVEQYPRYIKLRAEVDASVKQYEVKLKQMTARADELRGTIQVLAEGSQDRADKEFEYQMLLQTLDYQRKSYRDSMLKQELRNTLSVYEDMEYVIGVVAKRKGVGVVMTKHDITPSTEPIDQLSDQEVKARVNAYDRRNVWFAAKAVDMTGDVIKELMIPVPDRDAPERAPKATPPGKE